MLFYIGSNPHNKRVAQARSNKSVSWQEFLIIYSQGSKILPQKDGSFRCKQTQGFETELESVTVSR